MGELGKILPRKYCVWREMLEFEGNMLFVHRNTEICTKFVICFLGDTHFSKLSTIIV